MTLGHAALVSAYGDDVILGAQVIVREAVSRALITQRIVGLGGGFAGDTLTGDPWKESAAETISEIILEAAGRIIRGR